MYHENRRKVENVFKHNVYFCVLLIKSHSCSQYILLLWNMYSYGGSNVTSTDDDEVIAITKTIIWWW